MSFEPEKFFIGLIDFFSIILPGALLTYLVGDDAWKWVMGDERPIPNGTQGWIVFFFASYLLGHFIFLLSALLDESYDWARAATLDNQIKQLAWKKKLLPWWRRLLVRLVFKQERNVAVDRVGRIKAHYLEKIECKDAVNNFQWSKARLAIEHKESLALVHRFEADSKFFRSLVVVMLALAIWYCAHLRFGLAASCTLLLVMAFWRFLEQRYKASNQAYWSVITLEGKSGQLSLPKPEPNLGAPTHAGGIVFKGEGEDRKYLLVQSKRNPAEWVLPKGHIEIDEDLRETAVREVREETGVWAEIVETPDEPDYMLNYKVDGKPVRVKFFLMKERGSCWPEDRMREHKWLPSKKATHDNTRHLLESLKK